MMIRLENGNYVNSDAVWSINAVSSKHGARSALALRKGDYSGEREYLAVGDPDKIADLINLTVIKAEAGYVLLTSSCARDDEFYIYRETIIAWKISLERDPPRPITVSGDEFLASPHAILYPDGTVIDQDAAITYGNLERWEAAAREDWAKERAKLQAKEAEKAA